MNAIMITNKPLVGQLIVAILLTLIVQCWCRRFGSSSNINSDRLLSVEESNIDKTRKDILALEDCGMPPTDGSGSLDRRIGGTSSVNVDDWPRECDGLSLEGLVKLEKVSMAQKERDLILLAAIEAVKTVKSYPSLAEMVEVKMQSFARSATKSRKMWVTVVGAKNGFSSASQPKASNEFITFSIGELRITTLSVTVMTRCTGSNLISTTEPSDTWTPEPPKDQWTPERPNPSPDTWTPEPPTDQWTPDPPKDKWVPDSSKNPDPWSSLGDWNHDPIMVKSNFNDSFNSFVLDNLQPEALSSGLMASKKQDKVCSYLVDKLSIKFTDSIGSKSWMCFSGPLSSTSFKSVSNDMPTLKVKMGPMRIRVMEVPTPAKSEAEVIAEARLNIDRTKININEMLPQYKELFIDIGKGAVRKHSTYKTIAHHIKETATEKWKNLKFHCVVGLEDQYWVDYWFTKPYLIDFSVNQLRIIVYSITS